MNVFEALADFRLVGGHRVEREMATTILHDQLGVAIVGHMKMAAAPDRDAPIQIVAGE